MHFIVLRNVCPDEVSPAIGRPPVRPAGLSRIENVLLTLHTVSMNILEELHVAEIVDERFISSFNQLTSFHTLSRTSFASTADFCLCWDDYILADKALVERGVQQ